MLDADQCCGIDHLNLDFVRTSIKGFTLSAMRINIFYGIQAQRYSSYCKTV